MVRSDQKAPYGPRAFVHERLGLQAWLKGACLRQVEVSVQAQLTTLGNAPVGRSVRPRGNGTRFSPLAIVLVAVCKGSPYSKLLKSPFLTPNFHPGGMPVLRKAGSMKRLNAGMGEFKRGVSGACRLLPLSLSLLRPSKRFGLASDACRAPGEVCTWWFGAAMGLECVGRRGR
jgi:hypothetical protein